jgi:transposase InsO family protein
MGKNHVIILAITQQGLSYRQVAKQYGVSKSWAHTLHRRFLEEGTEGLTPRSKRPRSSPSQTSPEVTNRIVELRHKLTTTGVDAGAHTITEFLTRENITISPITVWRILKQAEVITAQPQKRPRSSYQRFNADQPNETWQSDFTHWRLASGAEMEIIGWIDDHSRFLLHLSAHRRISGKTVTTSFSQAADEYGWPASTLTDNGMVYTTRHAGGRRGEGNKNAFETLLSLEGITQKNGRPYKPTTQGKIERLWQTLKLFLTAQPEAHGIEELQHQLDAFRHYYNHIRPHRALNRNTPATAYSLIPKATPTGSESIWKVRYDKVNEGRITLRYGNKMLHLGVGRQHEREEIIALIKDRDVTIIDTQGTVLGEYEINPEKNYQAKK